MKYLLDTHILFWALSAEDKLPEEALKCINDPDPLCGKVKKKRGRTGAP